MHRPLHMRTKRKENKSRKENMNTNAKKKKKCNEDERRKVNPLGVNVSRKMLLQYKESPLSPSQHNKTRHVPQVSDLLQLQFYGMVNNNN